MTASEAKKTSKLMIPKPMANKFFFGRSTSRRTTPIKMIMVNRIIKISKPLNFVDVSPAAASSIANPPFCINGYTHLLICYLPYWLDARGKTNFCQINQLNPVFSVNFTDHPMIFNIDNLIIIFSFSLHKQDLYIIACI